ncbi:NAD(P)-dependent oxidoreductase [Roseomonas marmotae]|uniref:Phosphoglycerate dehydrogenase n=1 Tax=Roseomonas marmotae TaxID=2768161 RepID=A0ABS3KAQ2_9PROT|nr:NAD(P)-dependent oxidoreductase [Roseomonas marmotae]MBO1074524.1 phosphoglycerate dehydrogenase [Roseomonas marmotae]QTI81558.1 phosphoglycerate dehydrogenase [Roseomonas marmotae]
MLRRPGVTNGAIGSVPYLRERILAEYPQAKFNEDIRHRMTEEEIIAFLADCDGAIMGGDVVNDRVLRALPHIRDIGIFGVGLNTVDLAACQRHGVRLGFTPGVNRLAVAELALCFMIAGLRWVAPLSLAMRNGERPRTRVGRSLTGRVVGLHGCGHIGKEVVRLLQPFGCTIITHDIRDYPDFYREHDITPVSFAELLERSEVLSLHIPRSPATEDLYDAATLARLRPDCVLVNTCRGGIVNEEALLERLESGKLVAACLDVFAHEPPDNDRLLRHPNLLSTPHAGASTREARIAMVDAALRGLREGELVDPAKFTDYLEATGTA